MRLPRTLWFLAVFAVCIVQIAVPCDNGSRSAPGQAPKDDRTVLLSAVVTNSGVVREAKVLSGPITLQTAAIKAVRGRKYKGKAIDNWGTAPVGNSARRVMLAVTFPRKEGTPPKIQQAMPAGVSSCVTANSVRLSLKAAQARLLSRVDPVYSRDVQNVSGPIVLRLSIDKDGNVYKAEKISGPDVLFPAATDAVKQWKYQPFLLNGTALEVETIVDVEGPASPLSPKAER
jgi:TonB-like protein